MVECIPVTVSLATIMLTHDSLAHLMITLAHLSHNQQSVNDYTNY